MKAFVSGQIKEKDRIRVVYTRLGAAGIEITHDWTKTDNINNYSKNVREAGYRADLDIQGVIGADVYILMTDNRDCGKGMYVELGAALALASNTGVPEICIVGPRNHESIFYYHPLVHYFSDLDSCLQHLKLIRQDALSLQSQPTGVRRAMSTGHTSIQPKARHRQRQSTKGTDSTLDLFP